MKAKFRTCRILSLILCLSMLLLAFSGAVSYAVTTGSSGNHPTKGTTGHIADGDTTDTYLSALNLLTNSRYAGRVWSDKSVFTNGVTLDLSKDGYEGNKTITNDSDFLHVFSAMGSNLATSEDQMVPLDVVFVLDISGSMAHPNFDPATRRILYAAEALNSVVGMLMSNNPYNRVALVTYSGGAQDFDWYSPMLNGVTMMDLGRYAPDGSGKYFSATSGNFDGKKNGAGYTQTVGGTLSVNASAEAGSGGRVVTNTVWVSGATNTQKGLYEGMNILANVRDNDTTVEINGNVVQRRPVVILVSDGQPTASSDNDEWWAPADATRNGNSQNNVRGVLGTGSWAYAGHGMMVMAVASYMKQVINDRYRAGYNKAMQNGTVLNDFSEVDVYTIGVDLDDLADNPGTYGENAYNLATVTLNPSSELSNSSNAMATEILGYWNTYASPTLGTPTILKASDVQKLQPGNGWYGTTKTTYTMRHPKTGYDITDVGLTYETAYKSVSSPDLSNELADLLFQAAAETITVPVGGQNDAGLSDMLTYVDPIGKYMEVKNVKNLLLFGELYTLTEGSEIHYDENGSTVSANASNYAYSRKYYTISASNPNTLLWNTAYGTKPDDLTEDTPGVYKLSDIVIYVETTNDYRDPTIEDGDIESDTGYDQALYIHIPASALPLWVASVEIDKDKNVKYTTNYYTDPDTQTTRNPYCTPLRVFYEVGMAESVLTEGKVDLSKVDAGYLKKYKDPNTGIVYFYSNWYADNKYEGYVLDENNGVYTYGDPVMTFSPSESNPYYIFQTHSTVYTANTNGAGSVERGEERATNNGLTPATSIESDKWYYIEIEYYKPGTNGRNGEIVKVYVPRVGGMFGSGIGSEEVGFGEYLCYIDGEGNEQKLNVTETNGVKTGKAPAGSAIVTRIDGVRSGNMAQNVKVKGEGNGDADYDYSQNNTSNTIISTSNTYYLPTISRGSGLGAEHTIINNYHGNNGRLEVSDTQLLVTKTVTDIVARQRNEAFAYTIKLAGCTGVYNAIKVTRVGEPEDNKWRAVINSIELLTDNNGMLKTLEGDLCLVDENGNSVYTDREGYYTLGENNVKQRFTGDVYNVFVGGFEASDHFTHTVFEYDPEKPDRGLLDVFENGIIMVEATLVPLGNSGTRKTIAFPIGNVDTTGKSEIGHEVEMTYSSKITYVTKLLDFDANNEAKFTLYDGEGLLFNGLDANTDYTVTETITQPQSSMGVRIEKIISVQRGNQIKHDDEDHRSKGQISGKTNNRTDEIHYYNTQVTASMQLAKEMDLDVELDPSRMDTYTFIVQLLDENQNYLVGKYYYYIHPTDHQIGVDDDGDGVIDTDLNGKEITRPCTPEDHEDELIMVEFMEDGTVKAYDQNGDEKPWDLDELEDEDKAKVGVNGGFTITLEKDQTFVILGLPGGAYYFVDEVHISNMSGYSYNDAPTIEVDDVRYSAQYNEKHTQVHGYLHQEDTSTETIPSVHVKYINHLLVLPATGGTGTQPYTLAGGALLLVGLLLLSGAGWQKRRMQKV